MSLYANIDTIEAAAAKVREDYERHAKTISEYAEENRRLCEENMKLKNQLGIACIPAGESKNPGVTEWPEEE